MGAQNPATRSRTAYPRRTGSAGRGGAGSIRGPGSGSRDRRRGSRKSPSLGRGRPVRVSLAGTRTQHLTARHFARSAVTVLVAHQVGVHRVAAPGAGQITGEVLVVVADRVPHGPVLSRRFVRSDTHAVWKRLSRPPETRQMVTTC